MTTLHKRQAIREGIAAQLAGKTAAETRVYETRMVPFHRLTLPAIAVYSTEESSDDQQTAPRGYKRALTVTVEAAVKGSGNVDDAMDAIALEIEGAVEADRTVAGAADDLTLTGTQMDLIEHGDHAFGSVRLQYRVTYYTEAAALELDDLNTIDAKTSLGGTQAPAEQAEDIVTLPGE